ncbi:HNH endonuclease [Patescibacteria group bacterium]|nr:HNH endonuclease [Patescibacteria group bacterium]MBU4142183.1 HNH endonuclease [Patescibacteria group bacterium]MCG2695091.1 HNH endonuclease [Candidatus Parcubacteria bacterium]
MQDSDKIISYHEMVAIEKMSLQRGMIFSDGKRKYSILLMSQRKDAIYKDEIDKKGNLIYEGHDARSENGLNSKEVDQPLETPNGTWTENGKFYKATMDFKSGLKKDPELVKVYEKIDVGVWSIKGFFQLVNVHKIHDNKRYVWRFHLKPVVTKIFNRIGDLPFNRLIPTNVKVKVWQRDKGRCVLCGSEENLHYDHDLPYAKGGTSLTEKNIRLLCAKCNLKKSDKIMIFVCYL